MALRSDLLVTYETGQHDLQLLPLEDKEGEVTDFSELEPNMCAADHVDVQEVAPADAAVAYRVECGRNSYTSLGAVELVAEAAGPPAHLLAFLVPALLEDLLLAAGDLLPRLEELDVVVGPLHLLPLLVEPVVSAVGLDEGVAAVGIGDNIAPNCYSFSMLLDEFQVEVVAVVLLDVLLSSSFVLMPGLYLFY